MKVSKVMIEAVKGFEGCRLKAYKDSVGVWTIGYGHTRGVTQGMIINEGMAETYLKADLLRFECAVNDMGVAMTQGQFDALVDFAYNLGVGNLQKSTLLKYIREGKPTDAIKGQFMRWNKAGGKVLPGLVKRRAWEAKRWCE